ncbi:hypothetical protein UY3_07669 [Chelonia mydas]|uniref:Uncharacterized protein n=1 Tax=Chelonia mydas TaxID=8469 RepID=M7BDE4_CHEMY|nr:hypothetical protein UY3_07669 [Chelonia mydas]
MNGGCCGSPASRSPVRTSYSLLKTPPWGLSCCFALQVALGPSAVVRVPDPRHGAEPPRAPHGQERLPLVQAPSFEFLIPAMVLSRHVPHTARNVASARCFGESEQNGAIIE